MNLSEVMDAVAARLHLISGLHVSAVPGGPVTASMAKVEYPDSYSYDATYGRGLDSLVLYVHVYVGMSNPAGAREAVSRYSAGSGSSSVKEAIESGSPLLDGTVTAHVSGVEFLVTLDGAQEYATLRFTVQLTGPGLEP